MFVELVFFRFGLRLVRQRLDIFLLLLKEQTLL